MANTQPRTTASTQAPRPFGRFVLRSRSLALWLLLLLALRFFLGMVTNLFVAIPAPHPGSGANNYLVGLLQGLG